MKIRWNTATKTWVAIAVIMLLAYLIVGCTHNPYRESHYDWTQTPWLVPLEYREPADIGKMCLGDIA